MPDRYQRPDSINPNVTHTAAILLDSPVAEPPPFSPGYYATWPIPGRLFSLAIALISAVFVGLSLRPPEGHPTQHEDAWYQVTLCLYFVALLKLLLDVDFGLFITVLWWVGFLWATWRYLARSRAVTRNIRALFTSL
jgi:hypothetical protein